MKRGLRQAIFWIHLAVGITAGVVIAIMCFTGVALSFEKQIIAWVDRDVSAVSPTAQGPTLSIKDAFEKVPAAGSLTISTDPAIGLLVAAGRTNANYVNQYTGAVSAPASPRTRAFMNSMNDWHRFLAQSGDNRERGKTITGACNFAFLFLAISGVYLWWPRNWNAASLRAILLFNRNLIGKARDWNWHNVIGFWSAPILIVLTLTALPMSYKWANDAIYKFTKTEPPRQGEGRGPRAPQSGAKNSASLPISTVLESVRKELPTATQITIRRGGQIVASVKDPNIRPRFSTVQLTLDAATGAIVKKETYADLNAGRRVRSWTRFLHTGEALGPIGQLLAGLASFGGLVLVWTGFALAIRRFTKKKIQTETKIHEQVLEEVGK